MQTPVAFMIFNRPETTEQVFAAIAAAKPATLLVIADGPRRGHAEDPAKCAATRAIIERVDWACDVRTNYAEANLGLRARGSSGITWVFEQVEEAIILEDDCLPDPTFFPFCEELLERYRDDPRVGHINGFSAQNGERQTPYSYYFSGDLFVWGWASWRRAWQHYDVNMIAWPELRDPRWLHGMYNGRSPRETQRIWRYLYRNELDAWDFQWIFACWSQSMLTITPYTSMVANVGFGASATGSVLRNKLTGVEARAIPLPLVHPPYVARDPWAEEITRQQLQEPLPIRIGSRLPPRTKARLRTLAKRFLR
jgi:hypothetical protein